MIPRGGLQLLHIDGMQEYLVRFAQRHETFRIPELEALATMIGAAMEVVEYDDDVGPRIR